MIRSCCLLVIVLAFVSGTSFVSAEAPQSSRGVWVVTRTPEGSLLQLYDNSWAVLIGINNYENPRWHDLNYAEADVDAVQAQLKALGFERFIVLKGSQATRERILEVLGDRLPKEVGAKDRVFVYFSGHGQTETLSSGEQGYLVPVDGDYERPYATAISMDRLRDLADRIGAKHVFFAVDACYSGFALAKSGSGDPRDWPSVRRAAQLKAKQIVTAGRAGEVAIEEGGHGLFTRLLLEGLSGEADRYPPHGVLTGSEVGLYLESYLPLKSGDRQTPQFGRLSAGEGEFMFILPEPGEAGQGAAEQAQAEAEQARREAEQKAQEAEQAKKKAAAQTSEVEQLKQQIEAEKAKQAEVERARRAQEEVEKAQKEAELKAREAEQLRQQLERLKQQQAGPQAAPGGASAGTGEMVYVPAGEFLMGSPEGEGRKDEHPQHTVYLDAYYIDKTEVTNAQYQAFVRATGHKEPYRSEDWAQPYNWTNGMYPSDKADHPVVLVDWHDADAYCRWAGKRLPTEAEWEKAARGTDGRRYPWGNGGPSSGLLNFNQKVGKTTPVGSYPSGASPYGALDMAGNVWEWCADGYDADYYINSPKSNPNGVNTGSYRVWRGGSWDYPPSYVRAASRIGFDPTRRSYDVGFRCSR